jgi:hypothetical protein
MTVTPLDEPTPAQHSGYLIGTFRPEVAGVLVGVQF